ncbi:MAG TPA: ribosome small subunit-dependent GTPase A [Ideonella sp.]|uniref:ribosome small subunit-dependent GTPase A n=1 Tax=Ideonella sp. TaxID=1929293 RepID=UPI002E341D2C|nr:ribosome small subunit-dependent GTPase A [Ideonella sp.]HEX5685594.1 ribosome small subunit-dependent GTPase A [Ideonella sp.]
MFDTIDFQTLRGIGLTQGLVAQMFNLQTEAADRLMRVVEVQRDRLRLHDGRHEHVAQVWPTLRLALQMQGDALVVGDWVAARTGGDLGDTLWAAARVPPLNHLVRRDSSGQRQTLVSNVDTALIVMGAGQDFNLRRLDRYLALVRLAGVSPLVVLSKADLCADPAARVDAVRRHTSDGVDVLALNGLDASSAEALAPWLCEGQTLVLLGSSGAGKSTLTNQLTGAVQDTGGVRRGDEHGRHTTTARSLHRCANGACIIDTPGLRGLQLDADEAQLDAVFDDISSLAPLCRFRDCQHQDEPGCAVRPAVPAGRLLSYHKLQREAQRHEMTVFDRHKLLSEWKARGRAAKAVGRSKRG